MDISTAVMAQSLQNNKQLLEKMKLSKTTGRMVVDLDKILAGADEKNDFKLRPGDHLIVDKTPDYVSIMGEVFNPTAVLYEEGKTIGYYLNRVGGVTGNAHKKEIYLVKANGDVISKQQEGFFGLTSWDVKIQNCLQTR